MNLKVFSNKIKVERQWKIEVYSKIENDTADMCLVNMTTGTVGEEHEGLYDNI